MGALGIVWNDIFRNGMEWGLEYGMISLGMEWSGDIEYGMISLEMEWSSME